MSITTSLDLTTEDGIVSFMGESSSDADWDARAHEVMQANGGRYPEHWTDYVITSGVLAQTRRRW